ncbi:DUF3833 domain-containing protein [Alteromonas lipolytica]|uniref:DUF3833 domain-containing protein n=1 Tax=Alteromonas lipolytica TaxID=1856405 RepID=A0A1E8F9W5_9ALTE|nr:DUF3833 domain-containing protein [Alteromonas lipolytica]OFI32707.1 hypothetical protein BFC17_06015 [Alteromonas lipolytica]GGF73861.1 hypothetical protein GCM10011338_27420 [Alteromonas lipolytica]
MKHIMLILLLMGVVAGCSTSIDGSKYQQTTPPLALERFFNGKVKAWGIVQNRSGDVVQRFTVDIDGRIEGSVLILDETFTYEVGEGPQQRTWRITPMGNGVYQGEAGDILGTAKGTSYGNAFNFQYEMDLPVDDTTYKVAFDDWFWAMGDGTLMNRSYVKKFGLVMAEVTIFMQQQ